ncbi:MAG: NADH-quinone oxidoreductase subunit I [Cytophagaceae bacterium]|nr:NADH-quinone oxidoreductase subunit I [Cytophagaceae bacterium]MDW8457162.1 NADH-quinone oxidoreductase subunit I [Cytophagaceae bacterium]
MNTATKPYRRTSLLEGISTLLNGFRLTLKHLLKAKKPISSGYIYSENYTYPSSGIVTVEFPHESIPVPDHGRYQLHNEIEDCIVCDLCAKICPVNCIEIVPIKSPVEIGKTSDGTTKRIYAAKFDIDMAKCCYCGLCTTVCPTECLTMTSNFDYSEYDIRKMTYSFSEMTAEEIELRKKEYAEYEARKKQAAVTDATKDTISTPKTNPAKIVIKPVVKPAIQKNETDKNDNTPS